MCSPFVFPCIMAVIMHSFIFFAGTMKSYSIKFLSLCISLYNGSDNALFHIFRWHHESYTIKFLIITINIISSCCMNMKLSSAKVLTIATIIKIIVIINIIKTFNITMKLSGIKFIIIIITIINIMKRLLANVA